MLPAERTSLHDQQIEHVHIVQRAIAAADNDRNGTAQMPQRAQLEPPWPSAPAPRQAQARVQVDGAGVQRMGRVVRLRAKSRLARVELARAASRQRSVLRSATHCHQ